MTDLRQAAQQALEALEKYSGALTHFNERIDHGPAITTLRTALEQQAEPVSHAVIAGALFDFMGWLTTRKERLVLSSTDNASPAADAIKDFAEMRGLLLDDAKVQDWQAYTTPPQQQAEPTTLPQRKLLTDFNARGILASKLTCWHRLTEEEANELVKLFIDHVLDAHNIKEQP